MRVPGTHAIILVLCAVASPVHADAGAADEASAAPPTVHIAIGPRVMQESWYESGELDVSIVPLVIELPLSSRVGLRLRPSVFYHFGGPSPDTRVSLIGGSAAPIFYLQAADGPRPYSGWFIGPSLEITHNRLESMWHASVAADGGYAIYFEGGTGLILSVQLGVTFFSDSDQDPALHPGVFPSFGIWL